MYKNIDSQGKHVFYILIILCLATSLHDVIGILLTLSEVFENSSSRLGMSATAFGNLDSTLINKQVGKCLLHCIYRPPRGDRSE